MDTSQTNVTNVTMQHLILADEKQEVLGKNCLAILQIEPINIPTAKYCYSFAQFFKLQRDHQTLGFDMHHLVNKIFNPQFDREILKLGN